MFSHTILCCATSIIPLLKRIGITEHLQSPLPSQSFSTSLSNADGFSISPSPTDFHRFVEFLIVQATKCSVRPTLPVLERRQRPRDHVRTARERKRNVSGRVRVVVVVGGVFHFSHFDDFGALVGRFDRFERWFWLTWKKMFSFEEGMCCCSKTSEEEEGGKGRGHVSWSLAEYTEHLG